MPDLDQRPLPGRRRRPLVVVDEFGDRAGRVGHQLGQEEERLVGGAEDLDGRGGRQRRRALLHTQQVAAGARVRVLRVVVAQESAAVGLVAFGEVPLLVVAERRGDPPEGPVHAEAKALVEEIAAVVERVDKVEAGIDHLDQEMILLDV